MFILIDKSVFETATGEKKHNLSFLLHIINYYSSNKNESNSRYSLMLDDDPTDYDYLKDSNNYGDKDVLYSVFVKTMTESYRPDCTITETGEPDLEAEEKEFSCEEGIRYLLQPLSIIVENNLNDPHFLNVVFRHFDDSGKLKEHVDANWIQFENAGGCSNVKNFIESRLTYFGGKNKFLRCFVLLDGDQRYEGQRVGKYEDTKKYLDKKGIPYHILEKRCMENYVPSQSIPDNKKTKEWKKAYEALSPRQRDYLNIGSGFYGDFSSVQREALNKDLGKRKKASKKIKSLIRKHTLPEILFFYADVSEGNFKHLERGLDIGNFKTEFPKFFNNYNTTKSALLKVTEHQTDPLELKHIAEKISKLI